MPTLVEPISARTIREREIAASMNKVDKKKRMALLVQRPAEDYLLCTRFFEDQLRGCENPGGMQVWEDISFMDMEQDMVTTVMTKARAAIKDTEPSTTRLQAAHNGKHHEAVQRAARQEVAAIMDATQVALQQRVETMQEPALVTEAVMAIANIAAHIP